MASPNVSISGALSNTIVVAIVRQQAAQTQVSTVATGGVGAMVAIDLGAIDLRGGGRDLILQSMVNQWLRTYTFTSVLFSLEWPT